ncbi:hypothetical protein THAR02_04860 [Trichoderma harzianum]|uniref:Uncharacterized protein n=1 Tax=Trichoderma harzianum TaxID=5544 RepID=A0A0G0ADF9_TRIHA|nr:hypothetical protein THAR02_04860 [Trichoderma harzianum]
MSHSHPFWYLWECPGGVDGSSSTDYGHITAPSTTASDEGELTPSTTSTRTLAWLDDDSHAADTNQLAGIQSPAGTLLPPEPTVLLTEICKAAEDVAQLVGRFGPKMAATLTWSPIKAELFPDRTQLRLPSLRYADSFTCRLTELWKKPVSLRGEAPLLWWLWDVLLKFLDHSGRSTGFTLEFTPACNTDMALPYTISITLEGLRKIEMTTAYGGSFSERRIFSAAIEAFRPPVAGFDETPVALAVDQTPYTGDGCYGDALDYLMPRPGSIWRSAMKITTKEERRLVTALAGTCKAQDDYSYFVVIENQDSQCKNLLQRLPLTARDFIENQHLVGKEGGSFSRMQNGPPGPKD